MSPPTWAKHGIWRSFQHGGQPWKYKLWDLYFISPKQTGIFVPEIENRFYAAGQGRKLEFLLDLANRGYRYKDIHNFFVFTVTDKLTFF